MANAGKTPPTDPLTARERRAALVVAAVVGTVAVGAAVAYTVGESAAPRQPGDPCITVSTASSMGGGVEHACGAAAQNSCRAAFQKQDVHSTAVQAACRTAGIRF
ncbi:hypothetical protein ABIA30_005454 [Mycobacterium sp. MAA66]|uniref:hypothetical protein n=1 Tax=Mycobacterium sp. MAA66 TaxID=3156297 RepID=UPI0035152B44